jgi:hypothetical protein
VAVKLHHLHTTEVLQALWWLALDILVVMAVKLVAQNLLGLVAVALVDMLELVELVAH